MVRGASPGPAPAAQARASNSRPTRSNWRTWPHRKLRRKVPRVDGALTTQPRAPAVPPVRNTSASSMQSPPASAEATRVTILSPVFARPGALPRSRRCWTSWGRPRCWANVAGRISPALATKRWSSKVIWIRSGSLRGSIYRGVGFVFPKPLSPKHRSTFLPLQHAATLILSVNWGLGARLSLSYLSSFPGPPHRRGGEIDYSSLEFDPDTKETPPDHMHQNREIREITGLLAARFTEFDTRPDVFLDDGSFICYDPSNLNVRVSPDVYLVFGVDAEAIRPRSLYLPWAVGKPPDFALEVASESTSPVDTNRKPGIYAAIGVSEFWRFDPSGGQ